MILMTATYTVQYRFSQLTYGWYESYQISLLMSLLSRHFKCDIHIFFLCIELWIYIWILYKYM
jgi:hypothetical protein